MVSAIVFEHLSGLTISSVRHDIAIIRIKVKAKALSILPIHCIWCIKSIKGYS